MAEGIGAKVGAVVLGAGGSLRMGLPKMALRVDGEPLVRLPVRLAASCGLSSIVLVTRPQDLEVAEGWVRGLPCCVVANDSEDGGMGDSLAAGLSALPDDLEWMGVFLGDMPRVEERTVETLLNFLYDANSSIVVPVSGGRRGHPVFFRLDRHRKELEKLCGDRGGSGILEKCGDEVVEVEVHDQGISFDMDTPDRFAELTGHEPVTWRIGDPASLADAFAVMKGGLVSLVGAGGKTSLMYGLAEAWSSMGVRGGCATTTKVFAPGPGSVTHTVTGESLAELERGLSRMPEGKLPLFGRALSDSGKLLGLTPEIIESIMSERWVEGLAVECDGSRRRPLKIPEAWEPVVPSKTEVFVTVAGLSALGKPFNEEWVFRSEKVRALLGPDEVNSITPDVVIGLVGADRGGMKGGVDGARKIVALNQCDDINRMYGAMETAKGLLGGQNPPDRVVAVCMKHLPSIRGVWC